MAGYKRRRTYKRRGRKLGNRQKRQVKVLIARRQELKYTAYTSSASVSSTSSITGSPFDIAQGDTDTTRDGDRLQWCGTMEFMCHCINSSGALSDVYNNIRVIIFQWHPSSSPAVTDILLPGPSLVADCLSLYNHDTRQQYRIMFDKIFKTSGNANSSSTPGTNITATNIKKFRIKMRKTRKFAQYAGGTLTGTNRFYLITVSDSSAAPHPILEFSSKIFFRDS